MCLFLDWTLSDHERSLLLRVNLQVMIEHDVRCIFVQTVSIHLSLFIQYHKNREEPNFEKSCLWVLLQNNFNI